MKKGVDFIIYSRGIPLIEYDKIQIDYHIKNVYDPITNTLEPTDIDANTDFDKGSTILNLYFDWCHYSSKKIEGETSGEHKIIFEWDTFDLPN